MRGMANCNGCFLITSEDHEPKAAGHAVPAHHLASDHCAKVREVTRHAVLGGRARQAPDETLCIDGVGVLRATRGRVCVHWGGGIGRGLAGRPLLHTHGPRGSPHRLGNCGVRGIGGGGVRGRLLQGRGPLGLRLLDVHDFVVHDVGGGAPRYVGLLRGLVGHKPKAAGLATLLHHHCIREGAELSKVLHHHVHCCGAREPANEQLSNSCPCCHLGRVSFRFRSIRRRGRRHPNRICGCHARTLPQLRLWHCGLDVHLFTVDDVHCTHK
mmetsp:Transcript_15747/g.27725  ORF Transcript_15747/g.27725 Transcript_15747/m.27725 type:complete len:269 (-) Transcript_15747:210-1016(-)